MLATAFLAASLLPIVVRGHGQINHVVANGVSNKGPNIYYSGDSVNAKTVTRVMYSAASPAYVLPSGFNDNSKMSCEGSANSPAPDVLSVPAGGSVDIYWQGATSELLNKAGTGGLSDYNPWVHAMGPIQDYITSCNGDCSNFDSTNAGWTKLAGAGLDTSSAISSDLRATMKGKPEPYYPTSGNGLWAMAKMVQDGSKWTINIPSSLKAGQYLLRNELSAVHSPKGSDPKSGPQLYIACVQVKVTGDGTTSLPSGTQAKDLYDADGAFANYDVYTNPSSFSLPGPAVWDQASSGSAAPTTKKTTNTTKTTANATPTAKATSTVKAAAVAKTTTSAAASTSTAASGPQCKRRVRSRAIQRGIRENRRRSD
ncbi:glycosyl hydrolase family 61-domain-containing protein [Mycena floridula]|nr:glycosyl hydrolase family 61-domain-containing protein [Mycena floridula]KAJ7588481.1 glycosyl hydrolase family 61-domain-containing protein [Mycena floridula]